MALGHAPLSLWHVSILALALFIYGLHRRPVGLRRASAAGVFLGLGYFLITLNWIIEPFLIDPLRHGWMAPFALGAMAGGMALFWGIIGIGWYYARGIGVAVGLALAEYTRAHLFGGFPWGMPAYILLDSPLQMALAWIGPFGATLAVALVAVVPSVVLSNRLVGAVLIVLLVAGISFIQPRTNALASKEGVAEISVRLVQPNAAQHQKWDPRYTQMFFDRMLDMSAQSPAPDVIIWPESAVAQVLNYAEPELDAMAQASQGSDILFGILRIDEYDQMKNSLAVLRQGTLAAIYDKTLLVPFGEYMPWEPILRPLGLGIFYDWFGAAFSPGSGPQTLTLSTGTKIAPLICYEAIFPQYVRNAARNADMIVHVTNDAWFGSYSGPAQHLAQARARAIETGRPVIRVANTGVSALIAADGKIHASIELNETGWRDGVASLITTPTPYLRYGDRAFWIMMFCATALGAFARRSDKLLTI